MRDSAKLTAALKAAGLPVIGCDCEGRFQLDPVTATPEQIAQAQQIVTSFDWNAPDPQDIERAALKTILAKDDADISPAEVKRLLLAVARRMFA
jgi:hypothetical protein